HENLETISGHDAAFQRIVGGLAVAGICLVVVKGGAWKAVNSKPQTPNSRETPNSKLQQQEVSSSEEEEGSEPTDLHRIGRKWLRAGPWILANSLAGQTLGVSFMQRAFETTPTGLVLSIIATTPIVVMPLVYVFEGERPTRRSVGGGLVAVAG